jgi:hypothetical protein
LSGELVFLFEDRALATAIASSMFGDIATDLAKRAGVKLNDLGMAEGQGGLLCVWGAHASRLHDIINDPRTANDTAARDKKRQRLLTVTICGTFRTSALEKWN